jgi:nicotinate-nucleotide adenylyltransferase
MQVASLGRPGGSLRYGVLGGTFDPPHVAHLVIAQEAVAAVGLDRIYFVPAGQPPHKLGRRISAPEHRLAMLQRAIAGNARFVASTTELDRPGPSYTVDTLHLLRAEWGQDPELHFILGWDMLLDLPHWRDPAGIVSAATRLIALHRPGYDSDGAPLAHVMELLPELAPKLIRLAVPQLDISATVLRTRVASSLPIRYLVPDTVVEYILEHGLYHIPDAGLALPSARVHEDTPRQHPSAEAAPPRQRDEEV